MKKPVKILEKNKKKKPVAVAESPKPSTRVVRVIAAPILRLKFDVTRRIRISDSEIGAKEAGKYLLSAIDYETGKKVQIALPAEVVEILERAFPGRTYIGKLLAITKHRYVTESKRYSKKAGYSIELEEENAAA